MSDALSRLPEDFDRGRFSRRQLLKGLGAVALAPAASAFAIPAAQAGAPAAQTSAPVAAPFEPTGWKTVLLDHFSCKVADYEKEAAFYNALMNWGVRSSDAQKTVLDIGDFGGIVIQGGYQPSAEALAAEKAQYDRRAAAASRRGTTPGPFVPRATVFDGFCWGIDQWDAKKVEAALKARGLDPVADNQGHDFQSFHVKDPDGFDVQISNGNRSNRRTKPASGHLSAAAPFDHTDWKTVWIDHISYQCSDYKKTVAFYQALLGWQPTADTGRENQVRIGDVGDIIIRSHFGGAGGASIDHIAVGITPFNPEEVKAALDKRGLRSSIDTNGGGAIDTAPYKSYHTQTPNGFDLQISNVTIATRGL
ncbi:MAG TPA: VOC family protein [Acidobacteriaceae bacterium]|nr:VOC family protein [Acidobacteriaceae bacterium]